MLDLRPLREHREYRLLAGVDGLLGFGGEVTAVAVPLQVFAMTRSALAVGMLGAAQLGAVAVAAPLGGVVADHVERRRLLLVCVAASAAVPVVLAMNAASASPLLWLLYVLAAVRSGLEAVVAPARRSVIPFVVPATLLVAVQPIEFLTYGLAGVVAAVVTGALIAGPGYAGAYAVDAAAFVAVLPLLALLRPIPPVVTEHAGAGGLRALREGLRFVRRSDGVRGVFVVDSCAMLFGNPVALFPALGAELGAGALGTSFLYAALPAGALLATLTSAWTRRVRRDGKVICIAAGAWGLTVAAAGVSPWLWGAVLAVAAAGAADAVSGVFRSAIVQRDTPPALRGRVSGLEWAQVNAGPALGDAEAGAVARLAGVRFSMVSGGLLCVAGVVLVAALSRGFRTHTTVTGAFPSAAGAPSAEVGAAQHLDS